MTGVELDQNQLVGGLLSPYREAREHRARAASMFEMIFGFMSLGILSVATGMKAFGPEVVILGMATVLMVVASFFAARFSALRNLG